MSGPVQLGSYGFRGTYLPFSLAKQVPPKFLSGPDIQRAGRVGVTPLVHDDFSKGFLPLSGVQRWEQSKGRVHSNEGVMVHMPGLACLPFKSTAQTTLAAVDVSGYRALNRRVHSIMSSLGSSSGGRFYAFVGPNMYKDTSTSNPALTAPTDNITNNVTAVWPGRANATDYLIIGTDGQTDDTSGIADPTASSLTLTEILTHANSADRIEAGWYFPQWDINAFMGTLNNTQGMWSFPGSTATLPYTSSTVTPVVFTETKDVANASATIITYGPYDARTVALSGASTVTNATNILADDGSYAVVDLNAAGTERFFIIDYGLDQRLPANLIPTGITVAVKGKESNAAGDAYISSIGLVTDVDPPTPSWTIVGPAKTQTLSGSTEFATTDTVFTFGGSQDRWGGNTTLSTIKRGDFGVEFLITHANTAQTLSLDYAQLSVSGTLPGSQVMFGKGATGFGPNPASSTDRLILAPTRSEPTAVTVEREPWILSFSFDPEGNRVTVSPTKVAAGMAHTEDACHHQGGYAICGGPAPGPAKIAKIIDSNGVTRSLGFPQVNGATAVRITSLFSANTALMAWVCNADSTDAQLWVFIDGAWNAYGALFSKTLGGAMSTQPLAYAERTMGLTQEQIYNFYPSSTNTAVMRQHVPADVLTDPFLISSSQTKQDGPLSFQTVELDVLPEEAMKAFTGMEVQSRRVDNNTAYGSVRWRVDTGGDTAFTSAEIDETFDAANETYTLRTFISGLDPGVPYKTAIFRCTVDHEAGSTETPNALPTIFYISADWRPLQRFSIEVSKTGQQMLPVTLFTRLQSLFETKNVQRFNGEGQQLAVKLDMEQGGMELTYKDATLGLEQPTWDMVQRFTIHLQETEAVIV